MSPRLIALIASGTVVLGALLKLFLDTGAAAPALDQARIDEARARHGRARVAAPAGMAEDPWSAARDRPVFGRDARPSRGAPAGDDGDDEPAPTPAPEYRPPSPRAAAVPDLAGDPRLELSSAKDEANRLYDKQDFDGSMALAMKVLEQLPGDVRMLRVVVSAACQLGDADKAQKYWDQLPPHDQNQMTRRCQRFGITFAER